MRPLVLVVEGRGGPGPLPHATACSQPGPEPLTSLYRALSSQATCAHPAEENTALSSHLPKASSDPGSAPEGPNHQAMLLILGC